MENQNSNCLDVKTDFQLTRTSRDIAPADYIFKIQSFSSLLDWTTKKVESRIFESGGYKWRLCVSSSGSIKEGVGDHISLYLSMADTDYLPSSWEVFVNVKLFVFNQMKNQYLSIQDVEEKVWRFHCLKTEWGYDQLLPMSTFIDPTNGYLVQDSCAFGAEIYVVKPNNATFELLDLSESLKNPIFTWKIHDFSQSKTTTKFTSPEFIIEGRKWKLELYPNGKAEAVGKSLSLFLNLEDRESLGELHLEAKFKLRIIDQVSGEKKERETTKKFSSSKSNNGWGFSDFLSFNDLNDSTKKYLVDNTLLVEVEFCGVLISHVPTTTSISTSKTLKTERFYPFRTCKKIVRRPVKRVVKALSTLLNIWSTR